MNIKRKYRKAHCLTRRIRKKIKIFLKNDFHCHSCASIVWRCICAWNMTNFHVFLIIYAFYVERKHIVLLRYWWLKLNVEYIWIEVLLIGETIRTHLNDSEFVFKECLSRWIVNVTGISFFFIWFFKNKTGKFLIQIFKHFLF